MLPPVISPTLKSQISLPPPGEAVTDKGFIDVEKGQIIDPILEVIE